MGPNRLGKRILLALAISSLTVVWQGLVCPSLAQEQLLAEPEPGVSSTEGVVELDGKRLFTIRSRLGPFSRDARARSVVQKLDKLLDDPDFNSDSFAINETESSVDIIAGDIVVTSITPKDAELAGKSQLELAESYVLRLKEALPDLESRRTVSGALEQVDVHRFGTRMVQTFLEPIALNIAAVFIGWLLIFAGLALVKRSLTRYVEDSTTRYNARKIVSFFGYILCFLLALVVFRDSLSNLTVILGAAAAGAAFALKEVIVGIAGWVAVTFGDFYKVGDRVQLGGIKGDVIDIGFARTTLMELGEWVAGDLYTGRVVRVSNSLIFSEPLYNYSRDFPFLWDELVVPVKFGSDYDLACSVLEESVGSICGGFVEEAREHWAHITRKYLVEHAQIEPMVTYEFNDNWVQYTVRYVVDYRKRRKSRFELCRLILEKFGRYPDRLALASTTFHLVQAPMIDVRLVPGGESSAKL